MSEKGGEFEIRAKNDWEIGLRSRVKSGVVADQPDPRRMIDLVYTSIGMLGSAAFVA